MMTILTDLNLVQSDRRTGYGGSPAYVGIQPGAVDQCMNFSRKCVIDNKLEAMLCDSIIRHRCESSGEFVYRAL